MDDVAGNLTGPKSDAARVSTATQVIRRTEVTIEREIYSIEVQGGWFTGQERSCPACGQPISLPKTVPVHTAGNPMDATDNLTLPAPRSAP